MIPISRITVLNPRARNKRQHREIVNNIEAIGLKRPITVSRRDGAGGPRYDLVCGEGRLEAFQMLGQTEIPAVVIEASESECLVMSLVENIARRTPRPIDLMKEIGALRSRGYSDTEIAEKIGVGASWVNMIASLLERGEERLVAAVETGLIPITLAMEISKAETEETQNLLLDAYETGKLRGKKLAAVRRLLDMRMRSQRKGGLPAGRLGRKGTGVRRMTAADLMQVHGDVLPGIGGMGKARVHVIADERPPGSILRFDGDGARAIRAGHSTWYERPLEIIHPDKRLSDVATARAYTYGAGLGVVLVRAVLIPVSASQVKAEWGRRRIAPRLQALQKKYKKNPELLQRKTLELYRSESVSMFQC